MKKMNKKLIVGLIIGIVSVCLLFSLLPKRNNEAITRNFELVTDGVEGKKVSTEDDALKVINDTLKSMDVDMKATKDDILHVSDVDGSKLYKLRQTYKKIPVYGKTMQLFINAENQCTGFTSNIEAIEDLDVNIDLNKDDMAEAIEDYTETDDVKIFDMNEVICMNDHKASVAAVVQSSNGNYIVDVKKKEVTENLNSVYFYDCYGPTKEDGSFQGEKADNKFIMHDVERDIYVLTANADTFVDFHKYDDSNNTNVTHLVESEDNYFGNTTSEKEDAYDNIFKSYMYVRDIRDHFKTTFNCYGPDTFFLICNDRLGNYNGKNSAGGLDYINNLTDESIPNFTKDNTEILGMLSLGYYYCEHLDESYEAIGHEFMHVISNYIVNWKRMDEAKGDFPQHQAINEGISDVFGEILEARFNHSNPDWVMFKRSAINPDSVGYPSNISEEEKLEQYSRPVKKFENGQWVDKKETIWMYPTGDDDTTDYAHAFGATVAHTAYLMNTGVNGRYEKFDLDGLEKLWFYTMTTLSSDCTFYELRSNMEVAAKTLGFSKGQRDCVAAAFEEVGIRATYANQIEINVYDKNDKVYSDYILKAKSKKKKWSNKRAVKTFDVKPGESLILDVKNGEYDLKFMDKKDETNVVEKHIVVNGEKSNSTWMRVYTNFGKEEKTYKFDETPVQYYNEGYLVKVDGKYGFINTDGEYLYEPEYPGIFIWQYASHKENLLALMSDSSQGVIVADGSRFVPGVGDGISDGRTIVFNASKKDVYRKSYIEKNSNQLMSSDSNITNNSYVIYDDKDVTISNSDFYNTIPYYVYIPQSERLYGKYRPDEFAFYSHEYRYANKDGVYYHADGGKDKFIVDSLFYVKNSDGYVIHNYDDTKMTKDSFDSVEWLSPTAAKVTRGNKCGIVNKDCDLVVWGEYEDISEPIDGKAFVKEDGIWKLINMKSKRSNHIASSYTGSVYKLRTALENDLGLDAENEAENESENLKTYVENLKIQEEELNKEFDNAMNMTDMKMSCGKIVQLWENAVVHIDSVLKNSGNSEQYKNFINSKTAWESEKARILEEASKENEGGSIQGLNVGMANIQTTKEFVLKTVENLE